MVELLLAAFILSIGLLGLGSLQLMAIKGTTTSRSRVTAINIGQSLLETIEAEARQKILFRTLDPGNVAPPALSAYFGGTITDSFNIYGFPVNASSSDPLERVTIFTTRTTGTLVPGGTTGNMYNFNVDVSFADTTDPTNATQMLYRTMSFKRKIIV